MIIIKSQDGKLLKLEAVVIDSQVNKSLGGLTSSSIYYLLGSFQTEERAKEVMGLIEHHIRESYALDNMQIMITDFPSESAKLESYKAIRKGAIFTMPSE